MTRLLLDTHAFIWFTEGNPQLSASARQQIENPANQIWVSIVSLWEIAIKVSLGKLALTMSLEAFLEAGVDTNGLSVLPIERKHLLQLPTLPFHHRDPFDRLLVAQSLEEAMPLVSTDLLFDQYGVKRVW